MSAARTPARPGAWAWLGAALLLASACTRTDPPSAPGGPAQPTEIGLSECGACGMVVSEQPAPRGQVMHRDGVRVFFCSVGDLAQYLRTPSPHGKAQAVWIERMAPDAPPLTIDTHPRPWARPAELSFVLGLPRPGVMGPAVMSYAEEADAIRVAGNHQARVLGWDALQAEITDPGSGRKR